MQYRVKISQEPEIFKVRVTSPPKAKTGYQVDGSLANDISSFGGANLKLSSKDAVQTKTITKVPREEANLEAEGGETVLTFDPSGYPLFYEIKGPRHTNNGVPLNLPDDSFIYSDTKSMMIKDPGILKMFNKPIKKGGYTPADLSKQFLTLNKYRGILQDSTSDKIAVQTAQLMIKKAVSKLGALALAQESKKGFPQGIPVVAKAYMEENNITEADILPDAQKEESAPQQGMQQGMQGAPQGQAPQGQGPAPTMPDGSPVAMPEEASQEMPQPGMRRGGFLPQAKKGLEQVLSDITDKVRSAMENGVPMTEIIISLIQNQVSVDDIKKVLMNLNIPDRQAQEFVLKALSEYQQNAQQQQQQMAAQQQGMMQGQPGRMQQPPQQQMDPRMAQMMAAQMQGGQGQPQMDPRQQQQAQPSEEQMMAMQQQQMQQAPMAAYGMQMGGYDMPDYMAYGGYYQDGGYLRKADNGEEVKGKKGNVSASKVDKIGTDFTSTKTLSGKTAGYKLTEGEKRANAKGVIGGGGGGTPSAGWEGAICDMIKAGATYEQLTDPDVAFEVTGIRKTHMAPGAASKAIFDRCNVNAAKFEDTEQAVFIDGEPVTECPPCIDPVTGVAMVDANGAAIVRTKDPATGECSECPETPENECFCTDPYTNEETIVPCGTDCQSWEQEQGQEQGQAQSQSNFTPIQNLPEDQFELAVAMGARNVNEAPIMGKAPGVREDAWGTDYMGQAELLKGQTRGTQDAIRKVSRNNPGGTMAALFNAEVAGQNNIINLSTINNADNATRATALRKSNVGHQWDQLLLGKQAQDTYNPQHATWASNVPKDNSNQWANIANKYGIMKGRGRALAATNAAQGMKWGIDDQGNEGYYNTNNTPITPTAPTKSVRDLMSDYKSQGITSDADALRAIDLQMRMDKQQKIRMGGNVFAEGGFLLGDTVYPFKLR